MLFKHLHNSIFLVIFTVAVIGVLIWRPLLQPGIMMTHDGENHLARFANYYLAVKQGQIPPRFAPNLFNRYGYPVFNFNYPLANMLSLPLSILQIEYESTFKFIISLCLIGGSVGVYFWLRRLQSERVPAVLAIAAYVSAPYILSAILFRGSIGEVMVYAVLPWLFWLIEWLKQAPRTVGLLVGIPLLAALLLAHNVTGLVACGILGVYAFVSWGKKKYLWPTGGIIVLFSLGLTLWFWLPALLENQDTIVFAARVQNEYAQHFVSLRQLLFSPTTFGYSLVGPVDSLSLSLGWVSVLALYGSAIVLAVWLLCSRRVDKKTIHTHKIQLVLIVLSVLLIFLQLFPARAVWETIGFLRVIQFPWRLSLFIPILLLPIFAWLWGVRAKTVTGLVLIGLCLQLGVALRIATRPQLHHTNQEYEAAAYSTSTQHENRPRSFTFEYFNHESDWAPSPTILSGEGRIEEVLRWNGSHRTYRMTATTPITLVEPTMYFRGWQTVIQNVTNPEEKSVLKYLDSPEIGGRIAYQVAPGRYQVTTRFTQNTPARRVGNFLFIVAAVGYGYLCWRYVRQAHLSKIK